MPTGRIWRGILFFALMCMATAASGLLSYLIVTGFQARDRSAARPGQAQMVEAQLLRTYANGLVSAANEFAYRVHPGQTMTPETHQWVDRQFRADVNSLRLSLSQTVDGLGEAGAQLLNAADRLAALAMQPDRQALRERALREVKAARAEAEGVLRASGADRWIGEPPVLPGW